MTRFRWPLLIVLALGVTVWTSPSMAQSGSLPTDHGCKGLSSVDTDQLMVSSSWGSWGSGLFSRFQFPSWGSAPARSLPGRTSVAVLRERRGLVR